MNDSKIAIPHAGVDHSAGVSVRNAGGGSPVVVRAIAPAPLKGVVPQMLANQSGFNRRGKPFRAQRQFVIDVSGFRPVLLVTVALAIAMSACTQQKTNAASPQTQTSSSTQTAASGAPAQSAQRPSAPLPQIDAQRAFQYTRDVVAFGPRFVSSPGHKKVEDYIRARLKPSSVEEDRFTAATPAGNFPMTNYIAKFPGTRDGVIVLCGHYDTIYNRKDFVGANDGGSSTGILLELASQLRAQMKNDRREGYSVWVVFFDGEEAFDHWTATDSTYGSRHLADKWRQDGTFRQVKALLLADMIGDADLQIERDQNSTAWLLDLIYQAASHYGYQSHFFRREAGMEDDHIPFAQAGIPVADLIDFDYGYNNAFWHTREDTMDKLSPKSFEIVGNVMLATVQLLDAR